MSMIGSYRSLSENERMLLTVEDAQAARKSLKNKRDWPYLPVAERRLVVLIVDQTALTLPVVPRRLLHRRTPDSPDH